MDSQPGRPRYFHCPSLAKHSALYTPHSEYRSAWKAEYKNLSAEIRVLRLADRFFQRSQFAGRPLGEAERFCLERARQLGRAFPQSAPSEFCPQASPELRLRLWQRNPV